MAENSGSDGVIGRPRPSGADFFAPKRGSKSLDEARIEIVESDHEKERPAQPDPSRNRRSGNGNGGSGAPGGREG